MSNLPERINVIKVITYNIDAIVNDAQKEGFVIDTVDDALEFIEEWVEEDFGSLSGLIFQDENGNEL